MDLSNLNSVIRLMVPEGKHELPLYTFKKYKENISLWYLDMKQYGLNENEIEIVKKYLSISYGVCITQEQLMMMSMDEKISGFSMKLSNKLRKSVAKKQVEMLEEVKQEFFKKGKELGTRDVMLNYVWNECFMMSAGYGFSVVHSTSYSYIGIQQAWLNVLFDPIYWKCARLLTDTDSIKTYEIGLEEEYDLQFESDDDEENETPQKQVGALKTDYFKLAIGLGQMKKADIKVEKPSLNKSSYTFKPDKENNTIYFGLAGITRINAKLMQILIHNRPYNSLEELLEKVKPNKLQAINLIKCGALDELYPDTPRLELLRYYCELVADTKKRLTMQNFNGLMENNFIPDDFKPQMDLYKITKHMRKWFKHEAENKYIIDANMLSYVEHTGFTGDIYQVDEMFELEYKAFEKFYKLQMEPVANWIKANQNILLENYNQFLVDELYTKYAPSSMEAGELDALSYYYTRHELDQPKYKSWLSTLGVVDFYDLPEEPVITWQREGTNAKMYKIDKIAGTCVGRDKLKKIVGFITPKGFVKIKVWQAQFVKYDRQIKLENGTKEPSWFSKGTKLLIQGYRSDDYFIPKYYKNSSFQYAFAKINNVGELQYERLDDLVANKPN